MPQPPAYERQTDFAERDGDDTDNSAINIEFDAVALTANQLRERTALIQRDDGTLKSGIVTPEALSPAAIDALASTVDSRVFLAQQAAGSAITSAQTALSAKNATADLVVLAELSQTASALNAEGAAASRTALDERLYPGVYAANPATRPSGAASQSGDQYFNGTTGLMLVFRAGVWVNYEASALASSVSSGQAAAASEASRLAADASAGLAAAEKTAAETARDAANVNGKIYATTAAGLAAVASGAYFSVPSPDSAEHLILYLNNAGAAVEQKRYPSSTRLDQFLLLAAPGYAYCIVDQDGVVALGVKDDGSVEVASLSADALTALAIVVAQLGTPGSTLSDVAPSGYRYSILDAEGLMAFGIKDDGTTKVSEFEADTINGVPVATIIAGGSGSSATLIGSFDAEINGFIEYGQSRSTGANSTPPLTTAQRFDNLKFVGGVRARDSGGTLASDRASLIPLTETQFDATTGETPAGGATDFIKELVSLENSVTFAQQSYQMLGSCSGIGGRNITDLSNPGAGFDYVKADITYGYAAAQALGKTYKARAFTWMQGESDYSAGTPGATWKTKLIQLHADINAHAKTTTGQIDDIICIQDQLCDHAMYGQANNPYLALVQLDLSTTQASFYLSSPTYPFTPYGDHHSALASKTLGAYQGLVYKRVIIDKVDWKPLSPASAYRQGSIAIVKMRMPSKTPLVFDVTTLAAQASMGFSLVTSANAAITVNSVTILEKDVVKIVAATPIPAGAKLRYGFGGIGNLRDSAGDTLIFGGNGLNIPMHNWCCIFEETLV